MEDLHKLRKKIDKIDEQIINQLEKRMEIVEKIIEYKKAQQLSLQDKHREKEIITRLTTKSTLDSHLIKKLFNMIFSYSKFNSKK